MSRRNISICFLSALFIILIILIKTNKIVGFDTLMYNLTTRNMNDTLTDIFKLFTFLGSTVFIIALCIFFLIIFILLKKNNIGFVITGVLIISTVINNAIKLIIRRPRPEVLKLVVEKTFSFPSGHTMASVSMYGILIYIILKSKMEKKYKIPVCVILGILPICIMISRVYLGAHFASDVIGGAIMSTILLLIETYYIDKKKLL